MNSFPTQAKIREAFLGEEGLGRQFFLSPIEKEILDGKKVLLKSYHTITESFVGFSRVGFIFILTFKFFSFSDLFKPFHSCFCSWRARGNIPFLPAKPALPAHREPWQPCALCPHPLPAAPSPPPEPPASRPVSSSPPPEEAATKGMCNQQKDSLQKAGQSCSIGPPLPSCSRLEPWCD